MSVIKIKNGPYFHIFFYKKYQQRNLIHSIRIPKTFKNHIHQKRTHDNIVIKYSVQCIILIYSYKVISILYGM